jgi:hypothetical protein
LAALTLVLVGSSTAQVVFVDDSAAGPTHDGSSWTFAYLDVVTAISNLQIGDTQIWVAKGTYYPGTTQASTHLLASNIAYYGGFLATENTLAQRPSPAIGTILSGDIDGVNGSSAGDCEHVVTIPAGSNGIRLDGFTIRSGYADLSAGTPSGGGIFMPGTQANPITDVLFDEVRLRDNYAFDNGGGLYATWVADFGIKFCVFRKNSADTFQGGGAFVRRGVDFNIFSTLFMGNRAQGGGGGLALRRSDGVPWIYSCEFRNNFANLGGGVLIDNMDAFGSAPGAANIGNCTFVGNEAFEFTPVGVPPPPPIPGLGGGLYLANADSSNVQVSNSIFWYNTREQGGIIQAGSSIEGPGSTGLSALTVIWSDIERAAWTQPPPSTPWPGLGNILADPLFVSPTTGDYNLKASSPCVDAGDDPSIPVDLLDLNEDGNPVPGEVTPYDLVQGNAREAGGLGTGNDGGGVVGSVNDMGCREQQ